MAARKTSLRSVTPDEKAPAPVKPKTVTQAARSGSARELLVSMRDRTAVAVENLDTPAPALAALTKRLMEIVREIEAYDARADEVVGHAAPVEDGYFDAASV